MRFDRRNRRFVSDKSTNRDFIAYDAPVLAVADGRVAVASDYLPDQVPLDPDPVEPKDADGHFVMLKVGQGRFVNYAHLSPGSVRVKRGQRVRAGQVIGRVGNSGQTGAPHLHFHIMDRPYLAGAHGMPFQFPKFKVGGIADLDSISDALETGSEP